MAVCLAVFDLLQKGQLSDRGFKRRVWPGALGANSCVTVCVRLAPAEAGPPPPDPWPLLP